MDLKTYLLSIGMSDRVALAQSCGTSYPHLRNIAYGSKPCGEGLAINIERETGGAVRCEELRPDVDWAYLRGTAIADEADAVFAEAPSGAVHDFPEPVHDDRRADDRRNGDRRQRGEQRQADRRHTDRRDGV